MGQGPLQLEEVYVTMKSKALECSLGSSKSF